MFKVSRMILELFFLQNETLRHAKNDSAMLIVYISFGKFSAIISSTLFFFPALFSPLRNLVTHYLFIYSFLAVLGLRCYLLSFSSCGAQAVRTWASVVAAHGLKSCSSQL